MTDDLDAALERAGSLNIAFKRRQRCSVCNLGPQALVAVHAVIWDVPRGSTMLLPSMRQKTFAANAEAALKRRGVTLSRQWITSHVKHVEETAHIRTPEEERQHEPGTKVFATDYRSLTDHTARLATLAGHQLERRIAAGDLDDRALVSVLSVGQKARTEEQKLDQRDRQHGQEMKALLLFGSGILGSLPDGEVDEPAVPITVLRAELDAERQTYYVAAGGDDEVDSD